MNIIETIRAEIDRRYEENREKSRYDDYYRGMNDGLDLFEQFLDTLQEKVEDELEFAKHLRSLWEGEKRINLDNLIDFWWMQEDSDDNRMVCKKEHFTSAMKKAYSLGVAQADTLEKQK